MKKLKTFQDLETAFDDNYRWMAITKFGAYGKVRLKRLSTILKKLIIQKAIDYRIEEEFLIFQLSIFSVHKMVNHSLF